MSDSWKTPVAACERVSDETPTSLALSPAAHWACRTLIITTFVILVATLFPFEFLLRETAARRAGPFRVWFSPFPYGFYNFFENVLLFMPFGSAWACWGQKRRWGRFAGPAVAFAAGAGISFMVEFLQLYLPTRDSGWGDVESNALGALCGYLLYAPIGNALLRLASRCEYVLERLLTARRIATSFGFYLVLTCVTSAGVQRSIHLRNWDPSHMLRWGVEGLGRHHSWPGGILAVQLVEGVHDPSAALSPAGDPTVPSPGILDPGEGLLWGIRNSGHFTLKVRCVPPATPANGLMLALRGRVGLDDFDLTQKGRDVVFTLRTPDLGITSGWGLRLMNIFRDTALHDLTITYDGSELIGYIDGRKASYPLRLRPGAILVSRFRGINPLHIPGYDVMYDLLVYVPLGGLLAFAARKPAARCQRLWLVSGLFLPALFQEGILAAVTGGGFRVQHVVLAVCLTLGGWLLANSDLPRSSHFTR